MASYNELNALIDAYINRNGVQAITGQILNGVLKAMVEQLGRGYTIMGAATPSTDPGTPDGPECYFASEVGTYTDFNGLQVVPGELALLCYTPTDGWTKETIYEGFQEVGATIDGDVGTPSVGVSYANGVLSFDFHNMKGNTGDPAGFGTIGATVDGNIGTPGVTVQTSGPDTAKNLTFAFTNLKGETGVTSVVATVDNTTGTPACTVSLVGQQLTLAFTGLKGAQGNTGVSADYPIAIINNLTTDDPASALSAAQGVVLGGKVSQLEAKVDDKFQVAYTKGILAITKEREFTISQNLVCKVGGTSYTIPGGSSFTLTNITANSSSLWAIIFDTANLRLIAKAWSSTASGDVIICAVVANSTTTISRVINCVVPYTFDGKYFTTAQTNEIISSVGLADLGQKYGVFYTKGILQFNSSRSVKNTENLVCRIGSTNYTIPAGTVSDLSNITAGYSPLWEIVFNISTLKLEAKAWNTSAQKDLVVATAVAVNSTIGKIGHCVVQYTLDGKDYATDVGYLLKNRLVPVATQGFINCDNVNKKFVTSKNIVIRFNNTTYTIPAGTEIQYSWSVGNTSLYKLCADVTANPLAFKIVQAGNDTELPVLFTFYGTGTSTANNVVVQVVTSVITTKIDGKDLADRVTSLENDATPVKDQNYQGEHILIDSNKFARKAIPVASSLGQSFASYGDYLVTCNYSDSAVAAKVMSLSNGTLLATLNLPYGSLNRPHCNVCCFGNEFGSADSIVPLLYVSQWDYEYERGVLVYDIKLINGVYSAELVQTIIPNNIGTEFLGAGCVDWVVDTDNSMIYALAYYLAGSSTIVEGNKEMVCKFALPKLTDGSLVELTESDILDNWEMEMFNFSQDKCYNSGKIFVLSGYDTYPDWTKIRVIDLARKEIVSVIPLSQYGGEPEGMDIVQGFLTYGYSGTNIYRLFF